MNERNEDGQSEDQDKGSEASADGSKQKSSSVGANIMNYYQSIRDWVRDEHYSDPESTTAAGSGEDTREDPLPNISSMHEHLIGLDPPEADDFGLITNHKEVGTTFGSEARGIDGLSDTLKNTDASDLTHNEKLRKRSHNSVVAGRRGHE